MENDNIPHIDENQLHNTVIDNGVKQKKKKKKLKIFFNIIISILFVVVLLNAVVGMVNMQKINNDEEPIWYLDKEVTETDLKTITEYNLGLYKIVKTDTAKSTKTSLKPFFLKD